MRPLPCLLLALALLCGEAAGADGPDLLFEVRLGQHVVAEAIPAYQQGSDVYLPLGELARLLTIAIRTEPGEGRASGYILDEQRGFRLDLAQQLVWRGERREALAAGDVLARDGELYVATRLLAQWLPLDLDLDLASLQLQVRPREKLPLQARLERQGKNRRQGAAGAPDPGYPRVRTPYALAGAPFIDQTLGLEHRGGRSDAHYTAYLTGDLLGAEAALYLNRGHPANGPAARLTLGRHDPDAGLLGPLRARSVQVGSVTAPGVEHIALASATGHGFAISNRLLGRPARFDRHHLQGDLPPGWDVELYYNDALLGFQQARDDGRYSFDDLPLNYGPNDFRLVFHGPLGQLRVERHSYLLEQAMLAPGELQYSVVVAGSERAMAQADLGLGRQLSASAGLVSTPLARYAHLGLVGYWQAFIASASAVKADDGGRLAQLALKTRIGSMSLAASRAVADGFSSDFYQGAVRIRDELQLDAGLAFAQVRRDRLASGAQNIELGARVSAYRYGMALSHTLHWRSMAGDKQADGSLQASRRMAGIGLSGQLVYRIRPDLSLSTLALAADKHVGTGYLLGLGLSRSFDDPRLRISASLNKRLGSFGMGITASYTRHGQFGAGAVLFMALGREPRRARWMADAAPMAATGAASLRVFLDRNRNGIMDGGDTPIPGAGFVVNGGGSLARTDEQGIAYLNRLTANEHVDIAVDGDTLEDPQWLAQQKGARLLARAGKVGQIDFAVGITGEIDGTAWLAADGTRRGMGDVELELLDGERVVATSTSSSDGYYIVAAVAPGHYLLRVSPAQMARLGLRASAAVAVTISADGSFVNGKDFTLTP